MQLGQVHKESLYKLVVTIEAKGKFVERGTFGRNSKPTISEPSRVFTAFGIQERVILTTAANISHTHLLSELVRKAQMAYSETRIDEVCVNFVFTNASGSVKLAKLFFELPEVPTHRFAEVQQAPVLDAGLNGNILISIEPELDLAVFRLASTTSYIPYEAPIPLSKISRTLYALGYNNTELTAIQTNGQLQNGNGSSEVRAAPPLPYWTNGGPLMWGNGFVGIVGKNINTASSGVRTHLQHFGIRI
jgi:hypothetical protein